MGRVIPFGRIYVLGNMNNLKKYSLSFIFISEWLQKFLGVFLSPPLNIIHSRIFPSRFPR